MTDMICHTNLYLSADVVSNLPSDGRHEDATQTRP